MKTQDAIDHYGSIAKLAKALDVDRSAVLHWKGSVPLLRQYQLEVLTKGALVANKDKPQKKAA
jgi:hypothetical protein